MNAQGAIAAMKRLHAGHYHENAKWRARFDCSGERAPARAAASAALRELRAAIGKDKPTPEQAAEIKRLFGIAHHYRCTLLRDEGFFHVHEGAGDTWAECYQDAERRTLRDRGQMARDRNRKPKPSDRSEPPPST